MKLVDSIQYLQLKFRRRITPKQGTDSHRVCWRLLDRSDTPLAYLIEDLDISNAISISYLILVSLQTVAIDSKVPREWQIHILDNLHSNLYSKGWNFPYNDFKMDGKVMLVNFHAIIEEFLDINVKYRSVISNAVKSSGQKFARHVDWSTKELSDWNGFCQDVAGVHGEAFSDILVLAELEPSHLADMPGISQSLAVFLFKVYSITHFYQHLLKDVVKWPLKLLRQHKMQKWKELTDASNRDNALEVLSMLVVDTLQHVTDVVEYLAVLTNKSVIKFVGYIVVTALIDVELCFMNSRVFTDAVTIPKSTQMMVLKTTTNAVEISRMINETLLRICNKSSSSSAIHSSLKALSSGVDSRVRRRHASLKGQQEKQK